MITYIDWCTRTNFQLNNEFSLDKTIQILSFRNGNRTIAALEIVHTKQYDWAKVKDHLDTRALFYILEEWLTQSVPEQHYLFSPIPIELFAEDLGFHPIDLLSIPKHLNEKLPPGTLCYRKEK